jgi:polar amino acid transport system substrate-binding protein
VGFSLRRLMAVLAVAALGLAACGEDNGEEAAADDLNLISDGTLIVCTDAPYEPFEFEDPDAPSGYSGFDIDLMQEIADRLGLTLEVVNTGFDPIESGVAMAADECDIAAAAMTILPERAENVLFSDTYFSADQSLLVEADSGITSLEDLSGQRIAVQSATTGEAYAQENAPDDADIVSFESPADVFTALTAGDVQAVLQDLPVNAEAAQEDDNFEVVEMFETDEHYGFAARLEGKEALVDEVNRLLAEMEGDGTYDEIWSRYFEA